MPNNWGGARPGAGRKAYVHIQKCRELLGQAMSDADWIQALSRVAGIMKGVNPDPESGPVRPRESIEAGKLLMRYAFGIPEPEENKEEEIEPIRIIRVSCSKLPDCPVAQKAGVTYDHDPGDDTDDGEPGDPPDSCTRDEPWPDSPPPARQTEPPHPVATNPPRPPERALPLPFFDDDEDDADDLSLPDDTPVPPRSPDARRTPSSSSDFCRVSPSSSAPRRAIQPSRAPHASPESHQIPPSSSALARGLDKAKTVQSAVEGSSIPLRSSEFRQVPWSFSEPLIANLEAERRSRARRSPKLEDPRSAAEGRSGGEKRRGGARDKIQNGSGSSSTLPVVPLPEHARRLIGRVPLSRWGLAPGYIYVTPSGKRITVPHEAFPHCHNWDLPAAPS